MTHNEQVLNVFFYFSSLALRKEFARICIHDFFSSWGCDPTNVSLIQYQIIMKI